jgi:hypothetical protein
MPFQNILDSSKRKSSNEIIDIRLQKENINFNGFKNIVETGAFAHYEQMFHFSKCHSHLLQRCIYGVDIKCFSIDYLGERKTPILTTSFENIFEK